jgi:hypothetical protein
MSQRSAQSRSWALSLLAPLAPLALLSPLALLAPLALACSADAVPEPEPTLSTRGSFVAVVTDEGDLELLRTLAVLGQGTPEEILFFARYGERPQTYEEATAISQRRDLTQSEVVTLRERAWFTGRDWRVVWFRSLSREEESAFR